jgi:hypothetical protein
MLFLYKAIGASQTFSFVATPRTITIPAGARGVLVQALTQNVRISFDANAPATASSGGQIAAGAQIVLVPLAEGDSFTVQQETSGASFWVQPVYWWTPGQAG